MYRPRRYRDDFACCWCDTFFCTLAFSQLAISLGIYRARFYMAFNVRRSPLSWRVSSCCLLLLVAFSPCHTVLFQSMTAYMAVSCLRQDGTSATRNSSLLVTARSQENYRTGWGWKHRLEPLDILPCCSCVLLLAVV